MSKEEKKRPSLLDGFVNQMQNHAALVSSGVENKQAFRIAYGDEEAEEVFRMIKEIEDADDTSFFNLGK